MGEDFPRILCGFDRDLLGVRVEAPDVGAEAPDVALELVLGDSEEGEVRGKMHSREMDERRIPGFGEFPHESPQFQLVGVYVRGDGKKAMYENGLSVLSYAEEADRFGASHPAGYEGEDHLE